MTITCPYCRVTCLYNPGFHTIDPLSTPRLPVDGVLYGRCPSCVGLIVYLCKVNEHIFIGKRPTKVDNLRLVMPKGTSRPPIPTEVPAKFADDYREACLVLDDSPKASAALSRRCLQHVIREKSGIIKKSLDQEITDLLATNTLPSYLSEELDAVRNLGNMAAHPMKNNATGEIVDVEPHEAEWTLTIIEALFDFYFVQPAVMQKKKDALNAKLASAGKPSLKS